MTHTYTFDWRWWIPRALSPDRRAGGRMPDTFFQWQTNSYHHLLTRCTWLLTIINHDLQLSVPCPDVNVTSASLLRGRDHGRRPVAGPRRRRRPRRALAALVVVLGAVRGHLQLRGQDLEHHLHVPVATGLHILVKLQYAAAAACRGEIRILSLSWIVPKGKGSKPQRESR